MNPHSSFPTRGIFHASLLALLGLASSAYALPWDGGTTSGTAPLIELDAKTASPTKLAPAGHEMPLSETPGGFSLTDFTAKKDVILSGKVTKQGGEDTYDADTDTWSKRGTVFQYNATGAGFALSATFSPKNGYVEVTGEIENTQGGDRAVILRYLLPLATTGATFEDEIGHSEVVTSKTNGLGTVFPLAAMSGTDWSVALAIPPSFPCCFGLTGSPKGLGVEFYLGLSPKPQKFPNKAPFSFVIYQGIPGWGYRSALAQYYKNNSDRYDASFKGSGFYLWAEKGDADYALPLFRIQGLHGAKTDLGLSRAKKADLLTTDTLGTTSRSIADLPTLPADYAGAMKAFEDYRKASDAKTAAQKEDAIRTFRDRDLVDIIERCMIFGADGKAIIQIRDLSFSPNAVTFTTNPNPWLFKDKGLATVGSTTVAAAREAIANTPSMGFDGVSIDSLGANFPAHLNYRPDHFTYEQYPLTFDDQGRVAIHNVTSHYELIEALREVTHASGKIVMANGIYRYSPKNGREENYHSANTGRFFIASLLDSCTRETSVVMERDQFEFARVAMGRKLSRVAFHRWAVADDVRQQLNRALPFTTFSLPEGGKPYLTNKNGYFRDKDLLTWFVKNARLLSDAGWQPMTYATTDHPAAVACERYGSGDQNYFALVNFGDQSLDTQVSIDLASLGLKGEKLKVTEIAQNAAVTQTLDSDTCHVQIKLDPSKACILQLAPAK